VSTQRRRLEEKAKVRNKNTEDWEKERSTLGKLLNEQTKNSEKSKETVSELDISSVP
jgi:hypothetical protein